MTAPASIVGPPVGAAVAVSRRGAGAPSWVGGAVGVAGLLIVWSLIATLLMSQADGVPTPWAVVSQLWTDNWSFYRPHLEQTGKEALTGYVAGNALAFAFGLLVLLIPPLERIVLQLAVASYCLPVVAVGPILSIVFTGDRPMSALAALSVFFTTLVGVLLGLRSADTATLDVVRAYGGGRWQQVRLVRLIAAAPAALASLKIAAPAALLGAIIGEYLGRVDAGLGVAMTISEQQLAVPRTWGIALVAGAVAVGAYALIGLLTRLLTPWDRATTGLGPA